MKRFCLCLSVFLLVLFLFASCSCGGEETPQNSEETTAPISPSVTATTTDPNNPTTPASTAPTTRPRPVTQPTESSNKPSNTTTPQSSQKPALPTLPNDVCLNDLEKMAIKALAFEKPEDFSGDICITYVFNDNAANLDKTVLEGMENKTVSAALRVNGTLYPITDYQRSGVYLRLNAEKAGVLLVKGVAYSVSLEFYDTNNSLLCYSRAELLATPFSTKKTPERKPLTVTLPTEGLNKVSVNKNSLSTDGFEIWAGSVVNLFDDNTRTKFGITAKETVPTLYFNLTKAETLTHYTVYTANDTATYPERNPAGWRLYGKVGEMWMLLSKIESNATHEPGIKATNSEAFSYAITMPRECQEYKLEFIFTDLSMQLGEITLYTTEGFSVSTPDTSAGSLLNGMQGVQVALSGFRLISELQNHVGVVYHFTATDSLDDTVRQGLLSGDMFATITLDNTIYQISNHVWNGDSLYLDLQSAGAPVFSNVSYSVSLSIYNASGERLYYTAATTMSSPYQTPNLPDRVGLNTTLPNNLTEVKVNTNSVKTENITHWGDGDPKQLFDGNADTSKIGGNVNESGEFTLTFSLRSQATLTYYTLFTGNDTEAHPERNPLGWVLYGKVNGEYLLLSDIRETGASYSGLQGVNATPFSYKIENPQSCSEYMIVFHTNEMFQLNEMVLYK